MKTIVEPQDHIVKLWGKQCVNVHETYRLMRYVLRVNAEDFVLLHNVVTGQLVVLEQDEAMVLNETPMLYSSSMEQLVVNHYLVPMAYDEHQQVIKLREILRKYDANSKRPITQYKILPTTACNARCYYCFEHGIKRATMSKKTADSVVEYIKSHCGEERINITWFGGEPTVALNRIDQISESLQRDGIEFTSNMISNGYLFDKEVVCRAKELWNLKSIQISVDGTEKNYNQTKAYKKVTENPYRQVMRNIGLLLEAGIYVGLRMNFDLNNYLDFKDLLKEAAEQFRGNKFLQVYAYPIIGEYANAEGFILHGSDEWLADKVVELNSLARNAGLYRLSKDLPFLCFIGCEADRVDSVVINPYGQIARCGEHIAENDAVGSIKEGITDQNLVDSWRILGDYDTCKKCVFFPKCVKLSKCAAEDRCYFQDRNHMYEDSVKQRFEVWKSKN